MLHTVNHNEKASCDRCVVVGRCLDGRMMFPNRTDDSFCQRLESTYDQGHSNFETRAINMILTFPLDPMHMV